VEGFVYPNEGIIEWEIAIVIYPFITGLVAGAFVVSSLYHVFGMKALRPVARFSLVTALAFLLVAPMPLMSHLGRPERALEIFLTPNLNSAMSAFGYIWFMYLLLVVVENWLVFRPDIVQKARSGEGLTRVIFSVLALGVYDLSKESLAVDGKLIKVLAFLGVPSAFLLHGYVGFIFGAIKANPWWSTPLMPVIFLTSAIVSGIALLVVMYVVATKMRGAALDYRCLRAMSLWLGGFLTLNVVLEGLEIFSMLYESEESWGIISELVTRKMGFTYFGLQFVLGAVVPLFVLGGAEMIGLKEPGRTATGFISALLILVGVFAMRWNVVVGGQLLSKSLRGFTTYEPPLWGIEGIAVAAGFVALPFVILAIMTHFVPPWHEEPKTPPRRRLSF
jgi:Ni/Fe-hydrogenase subunit HybB-like protein